MHVDKKTLFFITWKSPRGVLTSTWKATAARKPAAVGRDRFGAAMGGVTAGATSGTVSISALSREKREPLVEKNTFFSYFYVPKKMISATTTSKSRILKKIMGGFCPPEKRRKSGGGGGRRRRRVRMELRLLPAAEERTEGPWFAGATGSHRH